MSTHSLLFSFLGARLVPFNVGIFRGFLTLKFLKLFFISYETLFFSLARLLSTILTISISRNRRTFCPGCFWALSFLYNFWAFFSARILSGIFDIVFAFFAISWPGLARRDIYLFFDWFFLARHGKSGYFFWRDWKCTWAAHKESIYCLLLYSYLRQLISFVFCHLVIRFKFDFLVIVFSH